MYIRISWVSFKKFSVLVLISYCAIKLQYNWQYDDFFLIPYFEK